MVLMPRIQEQHSCTEARVVQKLVGHRANTLLRGDLTIVIESSVTSFVSLVVVSILVRLRS